MSNARKYILALIIAFVITIPIASVIITFIFNTAVFLIILAIVYSVVLAFVIKEFDYDKDWCLMVKRLSQAADNG